MIQAAIDTGSTRPYLIRAIYEWCTDNGLTPYLAVHVDEAVKVPMEHVRDNEIVLNISFDATSGLKLGNDYIEFKARFSGTPRDILVPVSSVLAIYARENGQGMAFPASPSMTQAQAEEVSAQGDDDSPAVPPVSVKLVSADKSPASEAEPPAPGPKPAGPGGRPALKRIK
jgi:stringent starvation protein B